MNKYARELYTLGSGWTERQKQKLSFATMTRGNMKSRLVKLGKAPLVKKFKEVSNEDSELLIPDYFLNRPAARDTTESWAEAIREGVVRAALNE